MKPPCKDCPNIGCGVYHDKCPEYQAFRADQLKEYNRRKEISNRKHDLMEIEKRGVSAAAKFRKTK